MGILIDSLFAIFESSTKIGTSRKANLVHSTKKEQVAQLSVSPLKYVKLKPPLGVIVKPGTSSLVAFVYNRKIC